MDYSGSLAPPYYPGQNPTYPLQNPNMMKSKSEMQLPGMHSAASGIASSYKDLLGLRRHDPPEFEVNEAVIKSTATGKHHVYKIRGRDYLGELEVLRRFREFDTLRKVLYSRFLGLYVPPIPEKKAMGKTEGMFVEERQFFLDRFVKEISQLPYLYEVSHSNLQWYFAVRGVPGVPPPPASERE